MSSIFLSVTAEALESRDALPRCLRRKGLIVIEKDKVDEEEAAGPGTWRPVPKM